jgi:hypothetical protein
VGRSRAGRASVEGGARWAAIPAPGWRTNTTDLNCLYAIDTTVKPRPVPINPVENMSMASHPDSSSAFMSVPVPSMLIVPPPIVSASSFLVQQAAPPVLQQR